MSLVVAGVPGPATAALLGQLERLGAAALSAATLSAAMEISELNPPELMICTESDWIGKLLAACPGVPAILATDAPQESTALLQHLRAGVTDVWQSPMPDGAVRDRLTAIRYRLLATASSTERLLSQCLADLERDQRAGRYIQMGMLPPNPMAIEDYRFQHRILPSLILSGDFVDYFRITDRHFAFYVADVSGHGASSAFVTVLLKNFSRRLRREHRPNMLTAPGEILAWINRELLEQKIDKYVALMLGVCDLATHSIYLVNGGHYPPAVHVHDGAAELIEQKGKPVGLFDEVDYETRKLTLEPGDRLVMFSDGVIDAMGEGDLDSKEQRLLSAALRMRDVDQAWPLLDIDVSGTGKPDDIACLLVQRES